jgi:predicted enzyme related to lactoylglutathione lyase
MLMPQLVIYFEIMGKDAGALQKYYGELFDWKIDASNPMNYGIVEKAGDGIGRRHRAGADG